MPQVVVLADLDRGRAAAADQVRRLPLGRRRAPPGDLAARVERTLDRAASDGYDMIEVDHRRHVEDFWSRSDVQLEGAPDLQQAVRFNLFELMQATARGEGLGVPAGASSSTA